MTPNFSPFFRGLRNRLQRFTKSIGRSLIILLIKESFAHAEIGQRAAWLYIKRFLVLLNRVVVAAGFRELFATGDCRARAQAGIALQHHIVWIDLDAAGLWPAKGFNSEGRFGSSDVDRLHLRIPFGIDT